MNLLADNPVLQREARWGRRLRRLGRNRPLTVMVILIVLTISWFYARGLMAYMDGFVAAGDSDVFSDAYDSGGLWRACCNVYLGVIVLLAPTLASSSISQEKEQQTWECLAMTKLTPEQVLLGKWLGRIVPLGWGLLLLLPLLAVSAVAGADLSTLPVVLAFLGLNAALYGMIGLLCSFLSRRTLAATTAALIVTVLLCLGTWMVYQLLMGMDVQHWDVPTPVWVNPFYVLNLLYTSPGDRGEYLLAPGVIVQLYWCLGLSVIALGFYYMLTRYRRAVRGGRPLGESLT